MIDYVTRGLAMLADEAEPAPIDSHEVIARARARTRTRRAVTAAAVATVAVVSSLVMTVGSPGAPNKPATTTSVTPPESLPDELDRLLTEALPDTIPSRWTQVAEPTAQDPPLTFLCLGNGCVAHATYNDGIGDIIVLFKVHGTEWDWDTGCDPGYCTQWAAPVRQDLPDGTRTQVSTYTEKPTSRDIQELLAARPDGTQVNVSVIWPQGQRSEPPLTAAEMLKFAPVFTYDATRDVDRDRTAPSATDDQNRGPRLSQKLTDVLADVVPADWSRADEEVESPLEFACTLMAAPPVKPDEEAQPASAGCLIGVSYRDGTGTINFAIFISHEPVPADENCQVPDCVDQTLRDGTRARMWTPTQPDSAGTYFHTLAAMRPDGTRVFVRTSWTDQRSETPVSTEELLKFATAFTF